MSDDAKGRVLCVEDNHDECELIREILKSYEVVCVETIAQGKAMLKDGHFSLVIIDEHLPDGSGMEMCRRIRQDRADLPVIMISGDSNITTVEANAAGAQDFLSKSRPSFVDDLYVAAIQNARSASA